MPTLQLYFSTHPNGSKMKRLNALQLFCIKGIPSSDFFFSANEYNKLQTFALVSHFKIQKSPSFLLAFYYFLILSGTNFALHNIHQQQWGCIIAVISNKVVPWESQLSLQLHKTLQLGPGVIFTST